MKHFLSSQCLGKCCTALLPDLLSLYYLNVFSTFMCDFWTQQQRIAIFSKKLNFTTHCFNKLEVNYKCIIYSLILISNHYFLEKSFSRKRLENLLSWSWYRFRFSFIFCFYLWNMVPLLENHNWVMSAELFSSYQYRELQDCLSAIS